MRDNSSTSFTYFSGNDGHTVWVYLTDLGKKFRMGDTDVATALCVRIKAEPILPEGVFEVPKELVYIPRGIGDGLLGFLRDGEFLLLPIDGIFMQMKLHIENVLTTGGADPSAE